MTPPAPHYSIGLHWFTNDLRIDDNPALDQVARRCDFLICVVCLDLDQYPFAHQHGVPRKDSKRRRFLEQSIADLDQQLNHLGQALLVLPGNCYSVLSRVIEDYQVGFVSASRQAGSYERSLWQRLQIQFQDVRFEQCDTHTLFALDDLPCALEDWPDTFSKFRRPAEKALPLMPHGDINRLPPLPNTVELLKGPLSVANSQFSGGSSAAQAHLSDYFATEAPAVYKQVRNELQGWQNSTKFSPWLANGSLSVRRLYERLRKYETDVVANESTYWIYFELLWREYFQWYAHRWQSRLYAFRGIRDKKLLTSYYPERFKKWTNGTTPYSLINACMRELVATGYLSNRGRQIVASCLVNECAMDWRYGAAFFEQHLLDYDPASNWGNWQYIAGVGADPRGGRHFNLDKQTQIYDPDGEYRKYWLGDSYESSFEQNLDSVDAADWPIAQ